MGKEFRFNLEKTKEHLEKLFPDENIRNSYLNSIAECAKIASKINNTNWNVNLDTGFLRFNAGNRYILNIESKKILAMCWRESFLQQDKDIIDDFLSNVSFHNDNPNYNPKTKEDLIQIPKEDLWNNSLQFEILPEKWVEKYNKICMPSVLDFINDSITHTSLLSQSRTAHSTGVINLINEQFEQNISQPEYTTRGNSQMTDYEEKLDEIKNNLLANRNVILTGAPGTGKTFMAKTIARNLGCSPEEIGFVQFHPSYDYTDFVEGLRPKQVDNSDQIGFERKDGVFKEFCERALKESYRENNDNVDNFEECWDKLVEELDENNFVIIPLISGKGDFRVELNEYGTGLANRTYENDDYQKGNWIQGKSKFFSKDQLYNIYQGLPGTPAGGHDNYRKAVVEYMKKNLGLLEYKKSETPHQTKKNFVFIIDEINRGEVAKIFGELFFCVDPGYRGEKGRIKTQYQNLVTSGEFQKGFFIPENVYIIGTMNDIDRSIESMDFAFRRRFSWIEVKASDTVEMLDPKYDENGELIAGLESVELAEVAKRRMENLNNAISEIEDLNEAYHIGASYFLKLNNYNGDFEKLWEYHLKGILTEYLRGNPNAKDELDKLKKVYNGEE